MLHVSFAMTTRAYFDCTKTETRRAWKPAHAAKFQPGVEFMGLTKDFRSGGERIHPARVVFCQPERLGDMSEESFLREGGTRYWANRDAYIRAMGGPDRVLYVLRFQHLNGEDVRLFEMRREQVNTYRCIQCHGAGIEVQSIEVEGLTTTSKSCWGAGLPTTMRRCPTCGAEDGPWVSADLVGGGW